jgi:hypothetical protein
MAKAQTIRGSKPKVAIPKEPDPPNEPMTMPEPTPEIPAPTTVTPEPFARDQSSNVEEFTTDDQGRYVATSLNYRELFVRIGGARYEHVDETPSGHWIYAKS